MASASITFAAAVGRQYVPFLRRHLRAAHKILQPTLAELSIALVADVRMAQLHQQFMGVPGPTDVLTFPLDRDRNGRVLSGEVVVCVPEARRQAKLRGLPVERELLLYALHGMLHLCGYDDRTTSAFRTMHRTEDQILTQLGVGPVFNADPNAAPRSRARAGSKSARRRRAGKSRATGAH